MGDHSFVSDLTEAMAGPCRTRKLEALQAAAQDLRLSNAGTNWQNLDGILKDSFSQMRFGGDRSVCHVTDNGLVILSL